MKDKKLLNLVYFMNCYLKLEGVKVCYSLLDTELMKNYHLHGKTDSSDII